MLTATLAGRPESTTRIVDVGAIAKRAIFPVLRSGWMDISGVVYENGAFLANWSSLDLPSRVFIAEHMVGSDLTITWRDWPLLVTEAYRNVELVLTA